LKRRLRASAGRRILQITPTASMQGDCDMRQVVEILRAMGPEQLLLGLVFLAGYALALGQFATPRGRVVAATTAAVAAIGFAAFSNPWEVGVMLVGFASVGMALFAGAAWIFWAATEARDAPAKLQPAAANASRTRVVLSSRSVKTAPILNSPGAE
jgi:hypothetical protein